LDTLPLGGWSFHVNVANNIAYLPEFGDGLRMVDVTDPSDPQEIGYFDTPGSANWIEVIGSYAFVADGEMGLYVLDMTNPTSPDSIVMLDADDAMAFNIQGNYLYLAEGTGCKIVDISDPSSPNINGLYDAGGYQLDVYASNNILYAAQGYRGLSILTTPNSPNEIANFNMENATAIHGCGDYVYVVDDGDLRIIDVSTPALPQQVFWGEDGNIRQVLCSGNYVYLGGYRDFPDLLIADGTNPGSPTEVGRIEGLPGSPARWGNGICVLGNYAYLAHRWAGLRIIDVSNPSTPYEVGFFDAVDYVTAVQVSGNYAYLADRNVGLLRVVDISNASAPFEVNTFYTQEARDVYVSGDYAYVINSWMGVRVIDISNPDSLSEVGFFDTGSYARAVYFNNYIYVADGGGGLYILENNWDPVVGINNENALPLSFSLSHNFPNPFNPTTTIKYQIPEINFVTLKVYDVLGSEIATLVNEEKPSGSYELTWYAEQLPSGVYFYRLQAVPTGRQAGSFVETKKMLLIK